MPISQKDMSQVQQAAVLEAISERFQDLGKPQYDSSGDDDGTIQPVVKGELRTSKSGAPWVSFDGGNQWYRFMDMENDETGEPTRCVLDDDGTPLGVADQGPLLLVKTVRCGYVAVVMNTGWNTTDEIIWE